MKFEGTQVNIPIKGIMRAGTDNLCADGAMNEVVGMEYKDGSWLPYKEEEKEWEVNVEVDPTVPMDDPQKEWETVTNIVDVYTHKTSDTEERFLFLLSDGKLLYEHHRDPLPPAAVFTKVLVESGVKDVSIVGNMVCVATHSGIKYYLWSDGSYNARDEHEFPEVSIRTGLGFMSEGQKLLGVLYQDIQGNKTSKVRDITVNSELTKTEKELIVSSLIAAEGKVRGYGGLTGYFYAAAGIRLKNGSVVCMNPPILLGRPNAAHGSTDEGYREYCASAMSELFPRSSGDPIKLYSKYEAGHTFPTPSLSGIVSGATLHYLYKKQLSEGWADESEGKSTIKLKYTDILDPDDDTPTGQIFSAPRIYANLIANSSVSAVAMVPDLSMTRVVYDDQSQSTEVQCVQICDYSYAAGNGLSVKIGNVSEELRENIQSICIFISPEVSVFKKYSEIEDFDDNFYNQSGYTTNATSGGYGHRVFKYVPARKKEDELIRELDKLNTLYLVKEIMFEDISEYSEWNLLDLYGLLGDNLTLQEQLPITAFDITEVIPNKINAYNYRLHIYDYKQKMFSGYTLTQYKHNEGLGQYSAAIIGTPGDYGHMIKWEAKVEIDDNDGNRVVVVRDDDSVVMRAMKCSLSPYIMYPSENAKKITIRVYLINNGGSAPYIKYEKVLNLKGSSLGFSYYIDSALKPIEFGDGVEINKDFQYEFVEDNVDRMYHNGLKVSDVAYPSYFPAEYTYRLGNEKIIGLARLTMPMSQDNFGNYSLIAFCKDGIYSLRVDASGNGAYTSQAFVSPEVCLNPNSICEIGGAVFFAGDKGLMVLTGENNVELYAPQLNGVPRFLPASEQSKEARGIYRTMIDSKKILSKENDNFYDSISLEDFKDFIVHSDTHLIYISNKNKLLAYNKSYDFSYFIDIPTHNTTKLSMSAKCDDGDIIGRTIWEEGVKSYTVHTFGYLSETDNSIPCLIQSRPIKVQQDDKCSYRVVLTGYFDGILDHWACLVVLGSLDADHWRVIGVKEKKLVGGFHNLGCLTERGSWKYLMLIFAGQLSNNSHIDSVDITVDGRYNNKKR